MRRRARGAAGWKGAAWPLAGHRPIIWPRPRSLACSCAEGELLFYWGTFPRAGPRAVGRLLALLLIGKEPARRAPQRPAAVAHAQGGRRGVGAHRRGRGAPRGGSHRNPLIAVPSPPPPASAALLLTRACAPWILRAVAARAPRAARAARARRVAAGGQRRARQGGARRERRFPGARTARWDAAQAVQLLRDRRRRPRGNQDVGAGARLPAM